ncbi:GNAT family N-acetyltransferase [Chitinophaga sp. GCM10012297]|uniref:GNAT family N-acetyltransferase n=1 Tax=Chitinophaga chungangae TaxID=2821488 RepID=A0ABS3YDU1_9BACT|nr:GNAT family N-acetyltransferase [Chitinophaga chungangae]MBO9152850.1 GNAT family N-acetyltransferase [Chitinophaga chungangae]
MLTISMATPEQTHIIRGIAQITWPVTFGDILTKDQLDYMMNMMYSETSLHDQMRNKGHVFLLAQADGEFGGYASYELNYRGKPVSKLHKIYVLPHMQGKNMGRALVSEVAAIARKAGMEYLSLNVNRQNNAVGFYERYGFTKVGEEDIDIGNGYFMNDAVMQMKL